MDKIINWLLHPTENGATYLQVVIIIALFSYAIYEMVNTFQQIKKILQEGDGEHGEF